MILKKHFTCNKFPQKHKNLKLTSQLKKLENNRRGQSNYSRFCRDTCSPVSVTLLLQLYHLKSFKKLDLKQETETW